MTKSLNVKYFRLLQFEKLFWEILICMTRIIVGLFYFIKDMVSKLMKSVMSELDHIMRYKLSLLVLKM